MAKGKFIALEGTDGSGKGEQTKLLLKHFKDTDREASQFHFPRYDKQSSWFATEYLKGTFGGLYEINPRTASLFYAMDRYAASGEMRRDIEDGKFVVSDRYIFSNMAHHGSKISEETERKEYFQWEYDLEYGINGIPKPEVSILLHVPAEVAYGLAEKRNAEGKKDLHEADLDYLKRTEKVYLELVGLFPKDFVVVECIENGKLLPIEQIHSKVWQIVEDII